MVDEAAVGDGKRVLSLARELGVVTLLRGNGSVVGGSRIIVCSTVQLRRGDNVHGAPFSTWDDGLCLLTGTRRSIAGVVQKTHTEDKQM